MANINNEDPIDDWLKGILKKAIFVFGLVASTYSFYLLANHIWFFSVAKTKEAQITNVDTTFPTKSGTTYVLSLSYLDNDSKDFPQTIVTKTGGVSYQVWQKLTVYYNPDNVKDVRVDESKFRVPELIFYVLASWIGMALFWKLSS